MRMVRCAVNPSLRALLLQVEVVKGAAGLRRFCFFSTLATRSGRPPRARRRSGPRGGVGACEAELLDLAASYWVSLA